MTGPAEERSYQWPRRYVYASILAVIIVLLVLWLVL